jgi:hypothetical protein
MKYKVLCDRFMDGDETIGDEIIEMLMSIHKLLSSVYDFSPSISLSKGFRVIRIEVDGEFYFFNVSDGERGGCMMVPIECIESNHPQSSFAYWHLHRILGSRIPEMEVKIRRQQEELAKLKADVNFALYRLHTSSWG